MSTPARPERVGAEIQAAVADLLGRGDLRDPRIGFITVTEHPGVMGPGRDWIQMAAPGGGSGITLVNWFDTMPAGSLQGTVLGCDDDPGG